MDQKDEKELLRVKKKYSIKYVLLVKLVDVYFILGLLIILSLGFYRRGIAVLSIILLIAIVLGTLIYQKKSAARTYISFYEDRLVYKRKFWFINRERTVKYTDIKDIVFTHGVGWYTRFFQKRFGYGNVYVYPKEGNIYFKGVILEVVENIDEVMDEVKKIVLDRIG